MSQTHYTVTETREIHVVAENALDATRLATKAFEEGTDVNGRLPSNALPDVKGDTRGGIKVISLNAERLR